MLNQKKKKNTTESLPRKNKENWHMVNSKKIQKSLIVDQNKQ